MNTVVTSREAILEACRSLARSQGLKALSMRRVAQACGVAVGSVYNYFPSKADLLAATVEEVWRQIFRAATSGSGGFVARLEALFDSARQGSAEYPDFFALHAMGFAAGERQRGRQVMDAFFTRMKEGLLEALKQDRQVRSDAFDSRFTPPRLVEWAFSALMALLVQGSSSCDILLEVIRRAIY